MKEIQMRIVENGEVEVVCLYPTGSGKVNYRLTSLVEDCPTDKRVAYADWFVLTNSGRVCLSVCEKSIGGRLMDGAEIREESETKKPVVVWAAGKKSRNTIIWPIPEYGKVIVTKEPQRFEFSYLEK